MKRFFLSLLLLLIPLQVNSGTPLIQNLIDRGELVLFHDYRSGTLRDWSENGNDGVGTNVAFQGGGVRFNTATSKITVADSAELQGDEFTLLVFGNFLSQVTEEDLLTKIDGGGTNYYFYVNAATITVYDGTNFRTITTNITGNKCVAVNIKNGEAGEGFLDGVSVGAFNGTFSLSADDAPLLIGNRYDNAKNLRSSLHAALIVNRQLTAQEHSQLYSELQSMRWDRRVNSVRKGLYGPELVTDGNMELAGIANWAGNATRTKQAGNVLAGSQVLRAASAAANVYANPTPLTATDGMEYRIQGWARGDGTGIPAITTTAGTLIIWQGTSAATWQRFDVKFIHVTDLRLYTLIGVAGYTEWDNISVIQVHQDEIQYKTDWGVHAGNTNYTAGQLQNSKWYVDSGTWKITTDIINGELVKVIECTTSGVLYLNADLFRVSDTLNAYGTWQWWMYKGADANFHTMAFITNDTVAPVADTYFINFRDDESIILKDEGGSGIIFATAASYANINQWYKLDVTRRQSDGQFTAYLDDVVIDTTGGSGTNPVVDNSTTTSTYVVLELDTGDKIGWSDRHGNYAFTKWHGEVRP
jgi:hypothetical protein